MPERLKKPEDEVCENCGTDEVYYVYRMAISVNAEDDEKGFEWGDWGDNHCVLCEEDVRTVSRQEFAETNGLTKPWLLKRTDCIYDPDTRTFITWVRYEGFHPNGEHVGTWRRRLPERSDPTPSYPLEQTFGTPSINPGMFENADEVLNE